MSSATLLLDADIVAYQLAAKSQRSYKFPGMEEPSVALDDWADLPERIDSAVSRLCDTLKSSNLIVCLSCPTSENFRLAILPTYKGNRKGTVKPEYLAAIKDYLEESYPSYRRDTLEADDIMGILSTMPGLPAGFLRENPSFDAKAKKIIVSEDKDMKTIPGWLFNPAKDKKVRYVSRSEADWWHLYQAVVGDSTDGYSGCPGLGPKKAQTLMGGTPDAGVSLDIHWPRVVDAFRSRGLTEADALVQARVARICRASDYDFNLKKVIPWSPT